jgi:hypothetical protein
MKNIIRRQANANSQVVLLNEQPLFFKDGIWWKYVHQVDGKTIYDLMQKFNEEYLPYFLNDIQEQLDSGVDRNKLTLNIPRKIETIIIGTKKIQIEI